MQRYPLKLTLANGQTSLVDADVFDEVSKFSWCVMGGYAARKVGDGSNDLVWLHKKIMGASPGQEVDHKDGDYLNNQRHNLRKATRQQQIHNTRKRSDGETSLFKGVHYDSRCSRRPWVTSIKTPVGKRIAVHHATEDEAARTYDALAREHFGEFACVNFPGPGERSALHH